MKPSFPDTINALSIAKHVCDKKADLLAEVEVVAIRTLITLAAGEPTLDCPQWLRDDLESVAADCEAGHPDYYPEGWQEVGRSIHAVLALFRAKEPT